MIERRCAWSAAALVTAVFFSSRARAEDLPRVAFVFDASCAGVAGDNGPEATRKLFGLEMDALVVEPAADVTTVSVRCTENDAAISVVDPITQKTVARTVTVASYPPAGRARAIAIAAAELVDASWAEAALAPRRVPPAAPPPPRAREERNVVVERARARAPAPEAAPPPAPEESHAVAAGVAVRVLPSEVVQVGGVLRYVVDLGPLDRERRWVVGAGLEGGAAHGRARASLGNVDVDTYDVGGALHLATKIATSFALRAGAGLRVGSTELAGHADGGAAATGGSVHGIWTAPHALVAARFVPTGALLFEAAVEAGGILGGPTGDVVTNDGTERVAFRGGYLTSTLCAGARF